MNICKYICKHIRIYIYINIYVYIYISISIYIYIGGDELRVLGGQMCVTG